MNQTTENNYFAGWEIILHEWKMRGKMAIELLVFFVAIQISLTCILTRTLTSSRDFELAWKFAFAKVAAIFSHNPSFNISELGHVSGTTLLLSTVVPGIAVTVIAKAGVALICSSAIWLLFPVLLRKIKHRADQEMGTKHLRGMMLISETQLSDALTTNKQEPGLLPFGNIVLPRKYESEHIFIGGKPRVGKSVMAKQQINAIRKANHRAVIGDFKGEYTEMFYDNSRDFILNPLDARGVSWNLFDEINNKADLTAVCDSLIPDAEGDDKFWSAGAKAVFRGILAGCYSAGKRTNKDIWEAVTSPIAKIAALCESTPSGAAGYSYIQDESSKQASGIVASLMCYISWLEFCQDSTSGPKFTINEFLDSDGAFVFLTGRPEVESTIRPMTGLFVDLLCRRILSLTDAEHDLQRKTYVFLDEFGNLQKLPSIIRFATAAASKGGVLVIAIQDYAAIKRVYGRESAETLFNACGTVAIFNVADPETAAYFSKRYGRREYEYARRNYKMSSEETGDGLTLSRDEKESDLILPSEIQMLPKLQFLLKVPEHNPALVQLRIEPINDKKSDVPAFILKSGLDLDDAVDRQNLFNGQAEVWKTKTIEEQAVEENIADCEHQSKQLESRAFKPDVSIEMDSI